MKSYRQIKPVSSRNSTNGVYTNNNNSMNTSQRGYSNTSNHTSLDRDNVECNERRRTLSPFSIRSSDSLLGGNRSLSRNERSHYSGSKNHSRVSSDIDFSPKGSPWGTSVSPKLRSHGGGVKTVQTVAGPLLASTRHNININSGLYGDVNSPGFSSRVARYAPDNSKTLTHQKQYVGPGQFPLVQLNSSASRLPTRRSVGAVHSPVRVRIAPPETLESRLLNKSQIISGNYVQDHDSTKSVLEVLKEISRKRIHSQLDEDNDDDTVKRQRKAEEHRVEEILETDTLIMGKRNREESPGQDDSSPRLHQQVNKRTCNNEYLSSLSSSRNLLKQMKRKSSAANFFPNYNFLKKSETKKDVLPTSASVPAISTADKEASESSSSGGFTCSDASTVIETSKPITSESTKILFTSAISSASGFTIASNSSSVTVTSPIPATSSPALHLLVTSSSLPGFTPTSGVALGGSQSVPATTSGFTIGGALGTSTTAASGITLGGNVPTSSDITLGSQSTLPNSSGFTIGGNLTAPANSASGIVLGGSPSAPVTTSGFALGGSQSTPATTTGFAVGGSVSTPATIASGLSTPATASTTSVFTLGGSMSTPSSGLTIGGSSTPSTVASGFTLGGNMPGTTSDITPAGSTPTTTSSGLTLEGSMPGTSSGIALAGSTPSTIASGFAFGGSTTAPSSGMALAGRTPSTTSGFTLGGSMLGTTSGIALAGSTPSTTSSFTFGGSMPAVSSAPKTSERDSSVTSTSTSLFSTPKTSEKESSNTPNAFGTTANKVSLFGAPKVNTSTNAIGIFGNKASDKEAVSSSSTTPSIFGMTKSNGNEVGMFGTNKNEKQVTSTSSSVVFGKETATNTFGFGAKSSVGANPFQLPATNQPGGFKFDLGSSKNDKENTTPSTTSHSATAVNAPATSQSPAPFQFNSSSKPTFSFGSTATANDPTQNAGGFAFGGTQKQQQGLFSFGSSATTSTTTQSTTTGAFSFGAAKPGGFAFGSRCPLSTQPTQSTSGFGSTSQPIFGSTATKPVNATTTGGLFNSNSTPSGNLFSGANTGTPFASSTPAPTGLFGSGAATPAQPFGQTGSTFGSGLFSPPTTQAGGTFGSSTTPAFGSTPTSSSQNSTPALGLHHSHSQHCSRAVHSEVVSPVVLEVVVQHRVHSDLVLQLRLHKQLPSGDGTKHVW
ncbi:hypothetical protein L9F63_015737 [Diploptera punctata]|uniref:Uncharacterized protein n=1 Tax=Diploptera punctata TaxID=6984 RepID=A0AAD8A507_DIPPU|nr:hypothetical protein L9F63_015737 [Diploptera punctata]